MKYKAIIALSIPTAVIVAYLIWQNYFNDPLYKYVNSTRDALIITPDIDKSEILTVAYLPQNWSPSQSLDFYTRPQGSLLVPYDWFLHLEQANNTQLFRDNANLNRLRFLPQHPVKDLNPDGLPVGFVKERDLKGKAWLGLTCAACHTAQINYEGVAYRIDGGPSMADTETFLEQLAEAMKATLENSQKFDRFAERTANSSSNAHASLRMELGKQVKFRDEYETRNRSDLKYGYARLDAFGRILNETMIRHIDADPSGAKKPNAPVSYPFIWDAPQHDWVQWNGAANNHLVPLIPEIGALARNTGEMLGVFGEVDCDTKSRPGYASSIRVHNLLHLEHVLKDLWSPRWEDVKTLPRIDTELANHGKGLFTKHCAQCHGGTEKPFDRTDPSRSIKAVLTPQSDIKTDDRMVTNFANREGSTGHLKGRPIGLAGALKNQSFGDTASGAAILVQVVQQSILGGVSDPTFLKHDPVRLRDIYWYEKTRLTRNELLLDKLLRDFDQIEWTNAYTGAKKGSKRNLLVYKARPLNGIWATGPYLHNGSVASLAQLLLPAKERLKEFHIGSRQFDPENVGFKTIPFEGSFLFRAREPDGRTVPGNSNEGHEYAAGLSKEERRALLEYLKTL